MLGFGVERGGWLVECQHERRVAHEPAGQCELLPLTEADVDAAGPRRPELRVKSCRQPDDHVASACAADGRDDRWLVVEPREISDAHTVPRAKLEAEKILEGTGEPRSPHI